MLPRLLQAFSCEGGGVIAGSGIKLAINIQVVQYKYSDTPRTIVIVLASCRQTPPPRTRSRGAHAGITPRAPCKFLAVRSRRSRHVKKKTMPSSHVFHTVTTNGPIHSSWSLQPTHARGCCVSRLHCMYRSRCREHSLNNFMYTCAKNIKPFFLWRPPGCLSPYRYPSNTT